MPSNPDESREGTELSGEGSRLQPLATTPLVMIMTRRARHERLVANIELGTRERVSRSTFRGSATIRERYSGDLYQTGGRPSTGHG